MKGVVFTEFLDMVEQQHSLAMVEGVIERARPASGGAYTAVGSYPHGEMVALVQALSAATGTPVAELLRAFGRHLFHRFAATHSGLVPASGGALEFLARIESVIHREVLRLYPDAQLPRFEVEHREPDRLVLVYRSARHMEVLAEGLIAGCAEHHGEDLTVQREPVAGDPEGAQRFDIRRVPTC